MTHCMLDLETWGTRPGCAIRSIGAVIFDPWQEGTGAEFYANIEPATCAEAGLVIDPSTAEWWESQSAEALDHLREDRLYLLSALARVTTFLRGGQVGFVWGHGASFDAPILGEAYRRLGLKAPWNFWNLRDTRTLFDVARVSLNDTPRLGTHHNALDDAKHQALAVQAAYKKLGVT